MFRMWKTFKEEKKKKTGNLFEYFQIHSENHVHYSGCGKLLKKEHAFSWNISKYAQRRVCPVYSGCGELKKNIKFP